MCWLSLGKGLMKFTWNFGCIGYYYCWMAQCYISDSQTKQPMLHKTPWKVWCGCSSRHPTTTPPHIIKPACYLTNTTKSTLCWDWTNLGTTGGCCVGVAFEEENWCPPRLDIPSHERALWMDRPFFALVRGFRLKHWFTLSWTLTASTRLSLRWRPRITTLSWWQAATQMSLKPRAQHGVEDIQKNGEQLQRQWLIAGFPVSTRPFRMGW